MAFEHPSGLPNAILRASGQPELRGLVFHGKKRFLQGGELNDMQEIIRARQERHGRLVANDGDRTAGAFAIVDRDAGTVTLSSGSIYVAGDEFPVADAVLTDVPMEGRISIGVRLVRWYVTAEDDPSLRGLVPGTLAEGEDGAAREFASIAWARADDSGEGDFYQVYLLQDGTILDQTPPPMLSNIEQAIRIYDRPHGHYIVSGCRVTALGLNAGKQVLSIEEGEANVSGFKIIRHASLRHAEIEAWDVAAVPGETHIYAGGASQVVVLDQYPLDHVVSVLLTKEVTVPITRGPVAQGIDSLNHNSVIEIVSVSQGASTFVQGTDYKKSGNSIDWGLPGAEPAPGSNYTVKLRFRDEVQPDAVTPKTITVSGGVAGGDIIIAYAYKLPRIDILGLRQTGESIYVKGVSARANPVAPLPPADVLPLCEIHNDWMATPEIRVDRVTTGVRMPTWAELQRYLNVIDNHDRLLQLERLQSQVDRRDPAAKRNMFVDPFLDDYYRDEGVPQTAAIGNGILQLAIEPTFYDATLTSAVMLDWVEEVIHEQALKTGCVLINKYQNFTPLPGYLRLTPGADFWSETQTQWASGVTVEFQRGVQNWGGPLVTESQSVEKVGSTTQKLPFLRQRSVEFKISGFFPGEILAEFTFDGLSILPDPAPVADASGEIAGSFIIPANVPAGTKTVFAAGAGGTEAEALFTGEGTLTIERMRQVTTINRWVRPESSRDESGSSDPQAQIFRVASARQMLGMDFHLCHIGEVTNHILVNQVSVETGLPTTEIKAEAFVSMLDAQIGWKSARYQMPVTTLPDQDHAMVIKTDDGQHSVSYAAVGGFDAELQQAVGTHPYPIGPRLDSVNARTWESHQGEALTFRLVAARYPVLTKTVALGTFALVNCSDLQVRAAVELPSADCSVVFELERAGGEIFQLLPYQVLRFSEFVTEIVSMRAVLKGTSTLSPILYAPVEVIAGRLETTGDYVTRAFDIAGADRISAYVRSSLPTGSTLSMSYDYGDGDWIALPVTATEISPDPEWVEHARKATGISGQQMRLKIELTGGPAARPRAAGFGAGLM
ncbi:DUF4815 domain-containing protein [Paradevosia shaoguanensis]|uniref:DUF4815 domain-containing protein n=1 Tax=Paradevosia shaoguanensis TaxID=1335043 RepID=UPI003C709FE2